MSDNYGFCESCANGGNLFHLSSVSGQPARCNACGRTVTVTRDEYARCGSCVLRPQQRCWNDFNHKACAEWAWDPAFGPAPEWVPKESSRSTTT